MLRIQHFWKLLLGSWSQGFYSYSVIYNLIINLKINMSNICTQWQNAILQGLWLDLQPYHISFQNCWYLKHFQLAQNMHYLCEEIPASCKHIASEGTCLPFLCIWAHHDLSWDVSTNSSSLYAFTGALIQFKDENIRVVAWKRWSWKWWVFRRLHWSVGGAYGTLTCSVPQPRRRVAFCDLSNYFTAL